LSFLGIGIEAFNNWSSRRCPLGVDEYCYSILLDDLADALARDGIDDADIRIQGSSARLYSSPYKPMIFARGDLVNEFVRDRGMSPSPQHVDYIERALTDHWPETTDRPILRRPFDVLYRVGVARFPSDLDFQVSSDQMVSVVHAFAASYGAEAEHRVTTSSPTYGFLNKAFVDEAFPALLRWRIYHSEFLRRGVTVAVFSSSGPARADSDDPLMSSHLRDDDWIVMRPRSAP
jgi:hypothetical protein